MISHAFIQELGNGKLREEEQKVFEQLKQRGIPITLYTEKRIRRRQLPLNRESLVVGDLPCIYGALKQLSLPIPQPNDYPASLKEFLHRRVWKTSLKKLEFRLLSGNYPPVFAKPANRTKRFTGCVFDSEYDLSQVYGVSRQEELWCSEVVIWLSEYRVYVVNSEIKSIDCYAGDTTVKVDLKEIQRAIKALDKAKESYGGYGIDFGVLDNGVTALIEMNEGFALGAYDIDGKNYTDLICKRWEEILTSSKCLITIPD